MPASDMSTAPENLANSLEILQNLVFLARDERTCAKDVSKYLLMIDQQIVRMSESFVLAGYTSPVTRGFFEKAHLNFEI